MPVMTSREAGRDTAERRRALSVAVRAALAERGMTLTDAINRGEADPSTRIGRTKWAQIEGGTGAVPKPSTLGKIAKILDVDLAGLLRAAGYDEEAEAVNGISGGINLQLAALRGEVSRLTSAIERLLDQQQPPPDRPGAR